MVRRIVISAVLASALLMTGGCRHKVQNPLSNIDSKQPDKGLFDRAMDSMRKARYQESRTLLDTLINTYPDSEYIARAKLALGDAWYAEGGTAAWAQAEVEYKDFQTFFPNLPEASEAQLKIANMHYHMMEKPDRDFAQAQRAAEEYRALIQQYPDSPLVPQAKQKLREVHEVLAERQFRIAHFYYLRDNYAASQARLQSLIESYPLYSGADEALFELGATYELEAAAIRKQKIPDAKKEQMGAEFEKKAVEAYSKIITRYPATDRVGDAKRRLEALKATVPEPTPEALAESKAEESSRGKVGMVGKVTGNFKKRPNTIMAAKVGDPNLEDEKVESAPAVVKAINSQITGAQPSQSLSIQPVVGGTGKPAENERAPGSPQSTEGTPPPSAPAQVNELQKPTGEGIDVTQAPANAQEQKEQQKVDSKQESSSKKKNKKGLRKLIPF
ncbi:MAG TPA: outer membrane protein assembly factor BamD [Candidatus Angelobacter sp.]|nr:outer membrane protein assembly factor BamD [Candidatus Angelobacter sp.]